MPAGMGFKIAEGYVLIEAEIDRDDHIRSAHAVGHAAGEAYGNSFGRALEGSGAFWLRRFRRAIGLAIPSAITITLPLMTARITAILGLAAALVSLASSAGLAAASIAVLIPGALGLISVMGILRMMLGDISKGAIKQALKALNELKDGMREVAIEAAKPGFEKFLAAVVTLGPMATRYVEALSTAIGDTAAMLARLMQTEAFRGRLQMLLDSTARGTRDWLLALEPLTDILVTLGAAVGPQFERLSHWIQETLENWREFLDARFESGGLQKFFQMSGDEAARWGRIIRNVLVGITGILVGAYEPGQKMADALERISAAFASWAWKEETHGKIRDFLHFIHNLDYKQIFQIAAAIVAFGLALKGLVIGLGIIQGLMAILSLGPVGLVLAGIAVAAGALAFAFVLAYTRSEEFREKVSNAFRWVKKNVFPVIESFVNWLVETLAPALQDAADILEGAFKDAWDTILTAYRENEDELKDFFRLLKSVIEWMIKVGIPLLARFVAYLIQDVAEAISTVMRTIGLLVRAFRVLAGVTRTAGAWLRSPVTGAIHGVVGGIQTLIGWIGRVVRALGGWRNIARSAGSWLRSPILGAIHGVVGGIRTVISWISNAISALQGLWNWLSSHVFKIRVELPSIPHIPGLPGLPDFNPFNRQGGIIGGRGFASGGKTGTSGIIMNEAGPEAVRLPIGSTVIPHGQTMAMLANQKNGPTIIEFHSDGTRFSDMLMEVIRYAVRIRGGDVQFVLGD